MACIDLNRLSIHQGCKDDGIDKHDIIEDEPIESKVLHHNITIETTLRMGEEKGGGLTIANSCAI